MSKIASFIDSKSIHLFVFLGLPTTSVYMEVTNLQNGKMVDMDHTPEDEVTVKEHQLVKFVCVCSDSGNSNETHFVWRKYDAAGTQDLFSSEEETVYKDENTMCKRELVSTLNYTITKSDCSMPFYIECFLANPALEYETPKVDRPKIHIRSQQAKGNKFVSINDYSGCSVII